MSAVEGKSVMTNVGPKVSYDLPQTGRRHSRSANGRRSQRFRPGTI